MEDRRSRRSVLWGLGGVALGAAPILGCSRPEGQVSSGRRVAELPLGTVRGSDAGYGVTSERSGEQASERSSEPAPAGAPTAEDAALCLLTEANIEGPYYRSGAPLRSDLRGSAKDGVALTLSGRVTSADCRSPLAGARVDIWHADAAGHYDNDGSGAMDPRGFHFRGVVSADQRGDYRALTIIPGRYLNGRQFRPAHIHVKLSAAGHAPLTTQLYFPDDPFNDGDPFIHPSLIMDVEGGPGDRRGHFDFVLAPRG